MKNIKGSIMLLIAAIIWGTAFVAQSEGMKYIEPFTYNALRMFIGSAVLIPVILLFKAFGKKQNISKKERRERLKTTLIGGIWCGVVLFTASSLQQIGIQTTTAGKSGFITALYIVIVPLYQLLIFKKRTSKLLLLYVVIAIAGFYLLCIKEDFSISIGDFLTLLCAFFFAGHIVVIDYFTSKNTDGIVMACIQFFVSGLLATVFASFTEHPDMVSIWNAKYTILYAGLLSSGVAYTLQILAQERTDPTVATLIMSLESVFAAISGWVILNETLSAKEGIGCMLVFAAVLLAQLTAPERQLKKAAVVK